MQGKRIVIIGGGFCGIMAAYHLSAKVKGDWHIYIINALSPVAKGIAYGTQCNRFLLNVSAAKMSALPDNASHFLDWLCIREPYTYADRDIVAKMFVPRSEYGKYLEAIYENLCAERKGHITVINDYAEQAVVNENCYTIKCRNGEEVQADYIVLATGNEIPDNPPLHDDSFYSSANYFGNPWNENSYKNCPVSGNILIVGNGLTMVDTVLGLIENGFKGKIYSLSPNGFNILPHRHAGIIYTKLLEELEEPVTINRLFSVFHKHTKLLRQFGLSAEPIVDSIRPISQAIWKKLSHGDKVKFLSRFRHLWGVARHRLPLHIYDQIQQLRIHGKLEVLKGRIQSISEGNEIEVLYNDGSGDELKKLTVCRIINCTGPSLNINKSKNSLIQSLLQQNIIRPDPLYLGIDTDEKGAVKDSNGNVSENIFTLGGTLRGMLWESTAIPELRNQAEALASTIAAKSNNEIENAVIGFLSTKP